MDYNTVDELVAKKIAQDAKDRHNLIVSLLDLRTEHVKFQHALEAIASMGVWNGRGVEASMQRIAKNALTEKSNG